MKFSSQGAFTPVFVNLKQKQKFLVKIVCLYFIVSYFDHLQQTDIIIDHIYIFQANDKVFLASQYFLITAAVFVCFIHEIKFNLHYLCNIFVISFTYVNVKESWGFKKHLSGIKYSGLFVPYQVSSLLPSLR